MSKSQALTVTSVSKKYETTQVLNDVSLDIQPGEFLSLVGASGCGKSTLLRIIAGLERQDAGHVVIGDTVVDALLPKERNVAMVFQNYALYPHMTVEANIATPLRMSRMSWWQRLPHVATWMPSYRQIDRAIRLEVQEVCNSLQLGALMHRKPAQLSGGQRQRVALARAMIRHPAVFLMDEPLSNLDAKLRVHLRNELVELHKRLGVTFVYVTHDQSEAMTMSDRIAVMVAGKIMQIGSPTDLYSQPNSLQVAQFIGTPQINVFPLQKQSVGGHMWGNINLDGVSHDGQGLQLALRPEQLVLDAERLDGCDVRSTAQIERIEHHGSEVLAYVHVDGFPNATYVCRLPSHNEGLMPVAGHHLPIGFSMRHALLFDALDQRTYWQ